MEQTTATAQTATTRAGKCYVHQHEVRDASSFEQSRIASTLASITAIVAVVVVATTIQFHRALLCEMLVAWLFATGSGRVITSCSSRKCEVLLLPHTVLVVSIDPLIR